MKQIFSDFHLFFKMIPYNNSLFIKMPTFLDENRNFPKILLLHLKKSKMCFYLDLDPDPDGKKIPDP